MSLEEEFGVEKGRTLLMAALESPKGILNAYEICAASDRMLGVAISGPTQIQVNQHTDGSGVVGFDRDQVFEKPFGVFKVLLGQDAAVVLQHALDALHTFFVAQLKQVINAHPEKTYTRLRISRAKGLKKTHC